MGKVIKLECKECGFSSNAFLGIGFLYPNVCEEILQNMKNGAFGETIKEAANTVPGAAVHQGKALFVCDNCGSWRTDDIIDLCSPIEKTQRRKGRFCVANECLDSVSYVMDSDIGDTYQIIHSVEQKCTCCQQNMRAVKESKMFKLKLKCPNCNEKLAINEACLDWD